MSEYQYYEFRAVDQSLTPEQVKELRALSSRAEITPNSLTNTYHYGDFRGDARQLMERYFDAHVYVSNFGTMTLMLRLPRTVLSEAMLAKYATDEGLEWWGTDEHTILEWQLNDEPSGEWMEGEGWMSRLLPLREELVRGDYRSLYLGWLASIGGIELGEEDEDEEDEEDEDGEDLDEDDTDDEETEDLEEDDDDIYNPNREEPPVPAGLGSLTAAQSALVEFLWVDTDLLHVAAAASPKVNASANSSARMGEWVARLPEQEVRFIVERILNGEGLRVQIELQSRFYSARSETGADSQSKTVQVRRTVADLLRMGAKVELERKQKEKEEREQRQRKEKEESARKRKEYLTGLVPRLAGLWPTVQTWAEEQKAASYDKACTYLVDMRDAYTLAGRQPEFDTKFAQFVEQNARRTALVRKLKEVGLTS